MPAHITRLSALALTVGLSACASIDTTPVLELDRDQAYVDRAFAPERQHLSKRPTIGLALAGGGY